MHYSTHRTLLRSLEKPTPEELNFVIARIKAENPSAFHNEADYGQESTLSDRAFVHQPRSCVPMKAAMFPSGSL
ncbi:conserved hypothetical protein [Paraburkholderia caribensis]|nr:conserved hypothetical protein [Paraburkholderia caribensis]